MRGLTPITKDSLEFDRKCLGDLGLTMPRLTKKYLAAVARLSHIYYTSPYFFHIAAARKSVNKAIYTDLKQCGFHWQQGRWRRSKNDPT